MRHVALVRNSFDGQLIVQYISPHDIGAPETRRRARQSLLDWWDAIAGDDNAPSCREEIGTLRVVTLNQAIASHNAALTRYMDRRGALLRWIAETHGGLTDGELTVARATVKRNHPD